MFSTLWKKHHRPSERDLRFLDLLARTASDALERKLTAESLQQHVEELTRFNALAVGRENRMIELKKEINNLCAQLGIEGRFVKEHESKEETRDDQ
jgi:GAF domain-containing protein